MIFSASMAMVRDKERQLLKRLLGTSFRLTGKEGRLDLPPAGSPHGRTGVTGRDVDKVRCNCLTSKRRTAAACGNVHILRRNTRRSQVAKVIGGEPGGFIRGSLKGIACRTPAPTPGRRSAGGPEPRDLGGAQPFPAAGARSAEPSVDAAGGPSLRDSDLARRGRDLPCSSAPRGRSACAGEGSPSPPWAPAEAAVTRLLAPRSSFPSWYSAQVSARRGARASSPPAPVCPWRLKCPRLPNSTPAPRSRSKRSSALPATQRDNRPRTDGMAAADRSQG
jgi:hypothetical protein